MTLGGEWKGSWEGRSWAGGVLPSLYLERRVRWRSCDKLQDPPHQHSCMSLSRGAFSSEMIDSLRTVRRRPAPSGFRSGIPSLVIACSARFIKRPRIWQWTMADACGQRLTASRRKRCDPNSDESRFPCSVHIEAHVSSSCDHQALRAFEAGFYSTRKWMLLDRSIGVL